MSAPAPGRARARHDDARTARAPRATPRPGLSGARKSMPCAAHISSIASTLRTLRTTRRSFHAAPIAIGTTSSLLPSVGIVSTLAGCDEHLALARERGRRYLRHHEAGIHAGIGRQERRQSLIQIGMHEPIGAALGDRREIRHHDREKIERHRDRLAVKVSAAQQSRRSRTRADCRSRRSARARRSPRRSIERVEHRTVHLRHAAESSRHPARADRHGGAIRGSRCRRAGRGATRRSAPARSARAHRGCARRTRPACRAAPRATSRRRRARSARAARIDERERGDRGVRLRAVDEGDPFLRPERHRLEPDCAQASRAAWPRLAVREKRPRRSARAPVRERREIAARADASLLRDRRIQPRVQHRRAADRRARRARRSNPFAITFARSSIIARTSRSGSSVPTPAAWLRTRFTCSSASRSGGIATSESLPKPVVTPYTTAFRWTIRRRRAAWRAPVARQRRQLHGRFTGRDREHVLDAKRVSVDARLTTWRECRRPANVIQGPQRRCALESSIWCRKRGALTFSRGRCGASNHSYHCDGTRESSMLPIAL